MNTKMARSWVGFALIFLKKGSLQTKSQDPNEENFTVSGGIKRA